MKLSSDLDKRLVFLDRSFESYAEILDFVAATMAPFAHIGTDELREAIIRRENQGTTYIGHRLILPHGYVDSVQDLVMLFIRLERELTVIIDNRRRVVKYVFAVITSSHKAQLYLKVLKAIAFLVTNHTHVLDNAKNADDLLRDMDQKGEEVDDVLTARELISCEASVGADDPVLLAVKRMESNGLTLLPVVNAAGVLEGVVDLADLFTATYPQRMVDPESLWLLYDMGSARDRLLEPVKKQWEKENQTAVKLVMKSGEPYCIDASAQYNEIVNHMTKHRNRFVVVIDAQKKVLGLIDSGDLVHRMIKV